MKQILVILEKEVKTQLGELISIWQVNGYSPLYMFYTKDCFPSVETISNQTKNVAAIIAFTPYKRSPNNLVDSPYITNEHQQKIPIGLVPYYNKETLAKFISTTCLVHRRKKSKINVTLLSQRLPRYLTVAQKVHTQLSLNKNIKSINWVGDVIYREDVLYGINTGSALSIYFGHGRAKGWVGYNGVQIQELKLYQDKPNAAILSLCCETASRRRVQFSFCEQLILNGISAVSMGAINKTLFTNNTRWAISISNELQNELDTIGDLIVKAKPSNEDAWKHYRLFGDPTIKMYPDENFYKEIKKIKTYE